MVVSDDAPGLLRLTWQLYTDWRLWVGMLVAGGVALSGAAVAGTYPGWSYFIGFWVGYCLSEGADWFVDRYGRPGR